MAHIKNRKHFKPSQLILIAAALPLTAYSAPDDSNKELPIITVKSTTENPYKVNKISSPKYTQPLVEALRNTPGITLQLGENGNTSAGDAFQMRGFSTQT